MEIRESQVLPEWKRLYEAAVLELDPTRTLLRVAEAERAVTDRMEQLNGSGLDGSEHLALTQALIVLRDLRKMASDGDGG